MYTNALRDLHQGFSLTTSLNRRQPYPYANENEQDSHGPVDILTGHHQRQRHCPRIRVLACKDTFRIVHQINVVSIQ
jgi:hypothetical protein